MIKAVVVYLCGGSSAAALGDFQNIVIVTSLLVPLGKEVEATDTVGGFAAAPGNVAITVPATGAETLPRQAW